MHYWIDDKWLCTHAGFSNNFFKQQHTKKSDLIQKVLDLSKNDLDKIDDENYILSFRWDFLAEAQMMWVGPLWCDYDEFVDILGINQIFGHTPNHIVRHHKTKNSEHYCIDIKLNHYAIYQDLLMQVKEQSKLTTG